MLSFEEFKVSRFYHPKVLGIEDESQDPADMRKAHRKDQEEQYERYVAQHEPKEVEETSEERRVKKNLDAVTQHVKQVLRNNEKSSNKSRAEYFRNYRRQKKCRHCGKLNP